VSSGYMPNILTSFFIIYPRSFGSRTVLLSLTSILASSADENYITANFFWRISSCSQVMMIIDLHLSQDKTLHKHHKLLYIYRRQKPQNTIQKFCAKRYLRWSLSCQGIPLLYNWLSLRCCFLWSSHLDLKYHFRVCTALYTKAFLKWDSLLRTL